MALIDDFDVLIVGAGPAGTSTWLHLHQYAPGLANRTVLIDQAAFPRPKLCAGGVGGWSQSVLDHLGVDLDIPYRYLSDVEFRYGDERWLYHRPNQFRMVQRADFDLALLKTAMRRGVVFRENEVFREASRNDARLTLRTSRHSYRVKAVVGADGALSRVRRSTMPNKGRCLAPTIQVSLPAEVFEAERFSPRKMLIDFSPVDNGLHGYLWHCPCPWGETLTLNSGVVDFRLGRGGTRADMKKIFRRELQARQIDIDQRAWSSHPIRCFSPDVPVAQPNILLVGDAAGIEPAFGGGIHMALSYGELAAQMLIRADQTNDFSFHGYQRAVMSHLVGGHIKNCVQLAHRIYGGKENPLHAVRQFFSEHFRRPDLLSLLLGPKRS